MGIDTRMPGFGVRMRCGGDTLTSAATISMQGGSRWGASCNLTGAGGGLSQCNHLAIVQRRIHAVDSQPRRGRQLQLAQRHGGVLDTAHDHPVETWGRERRDLACCCRSLCVCVATYSYKNTHRTHTERTHTMQIHVPRVGSLPALSLISLSSRHRPWPSLYPSPRSLTPPSFTWWSTCWAAPG